MIIVNSTKNVCMMTKLDILFLGQLVVTHFPIIRLKLQFSLFAIKGGAKGFSLLGGYQWNFWSWDSVVSELMHLDQMIMTHRNYRKSSLYWNRSDRKTIPFSAVWRLLRFENMVIIGIIWMMKSLKNGMKAEATNYLELPWQLC